MIDEEGLEKAYWEFIDERARTGAERDAFKHKVRVFLRNHQRRLCALLDRSEIYLVAYTTNHEPPGGLERARAFRREMMQALEDYRRGEAERL